MSVQVARGQLRAGVGVGVSAWPCTDGGGRAGKFLCLRPCALSFVLICFVHGQVNEALGVLCGVVLRLVNEI